MDNLLRTPRNKSRMLDNDDLSLQSPPMLAQTPRIGNSAGTPKDFDDDQGSAVFAKRTIADIATPRKPGSAEARMQEETAYINTPGRAPHSAKRLMRSESPLGFKISLGPDDRAQQLLMDEVEADYDEPLLDQNCALVLSPPRFTLPIEVIDNAGESAVSTLGDGDMLADDLSETFAKPALPDAEVLDVDVDELEFKAVEAEEAVVDMPTAPEADMTAAPEVVVDAPAAPEPVGNGECDTDTDNDSDIEFTTANTHEGDCESRLDMADTPEYHPEEEIEHMDCSVEPPAPQPIDSALDSTTSPTDDDARDADLPGVSSPLVSRFEMPVIDHSKIECAELSTAKILSDPELMYAASIPLPGTPSLANQSTTPSAKKDSDASDSADFFIPTSWLMSPSPANRRQSQALADMAGPSTPTRGGSPSARPDSLIPVTPANQRLLDSLEIQWVSPRRVPKFSEVDMEAVRAEYEDKMKRQNELREMLLEALKDEYALNMRKQVDMADQALREAEDLFQKHAAQREREFEERLRAAETNHLGEIARRDEDTRVQQAQLSREIENLITERADISTELAQTRQTLDEYVVTSGRLLDEKESETNGLTRELGKLTLERQRLQEQLGEALKSAEDLCTKHADALQLIDALEAAKRQSDELNNTLHNDVLVSEERAAKIKEYAESKLGQANAEISSAHEQLAAVRQEAAALKAQATKSDARARSLQIQLDSTKRQNEELLALCERLEGSF
ncbi:hypothetical protein IWW38_001697 [Coemansia aciculifera]|uniref:Uncharacterized protein n=1 Tax=Coemansia aciculifera TaxID=417176 RepID=A0ACC1M576_9FUNG|nr:hypothetical protein IWW38_001697 [Coemansia aciculifera]